MVISTLNCTENLVRMNLVGLAIGNGWSSPFDQAIYAEFLYQVILHGVATLSPEIFPTKLMFRLD